MIFIHWTISRTGPWSLRERKQVFFCGSEPYSCPNFMLPASSFQFSLVQSLSCVQHFVTPLTAAGQASLFITILLKLAQTHVHWVGDAIQPSHPLLSPSPAFNLSQHQGSFPMNQLFTSGGQSIRASASASVLPMNTQDWFPLGLTGLISLQSKRLSRGFSNSTVQKHQFFSTQHSLAFSFLYSPTLTSIHDYCKNHSFD